MATWTDYIDHVRETNPEIGRDLDEVETISRIVGGIIDYAGSRCFRRPDEKGACHREQE